MEDVTQKVAAAVCEARDKALQALLDQCLGERAWSMADAPSKGSLREIPTSLPMGIGGWSCLHYSTTAVAWEGKPLGLVFVKVRAKGAAINVESWIVRQPFVDASTGGALLRA